MKWDGMELAGEGGQDRAGLQEEERGTRDRTVEKGVRMAARNPIMEHDENPLTIPIPSFFTTHTSLFPATQA